MPLNEDIDCLLAYEQKAFLHTVIKRKHLSLENFSSSLKDLASSIWRIRLVIHTKKRHLRIFKYRYCILRTTGRLSERRTACNMYFESLLLGLSLIRQGFFCSVCIGFLYTPCTLFREKNLVHSLSKTPTHPKTQ